MKHPKRNFLALTLAAAMLLSLCACGGNKPSPAPSYETAPPATDSDNTGTTDKTGGINDTSDIENSDVSAAPEAANPADSEDADPAAEETLNHDIQQEVAAQPEESGLKGLILMTTTVPTFGSTSPKTISIDSLDPDTGAMQSIFQFEYGKTGNYNTPNSPVNGIGAGYYATRREWFDENYERLAAGRTIEGKNESHAGWIDRDGNFFDVTAALGFGAKSDFDSPVGQGAIGFTADGQFVYSELVGERPNVHIAYRSVPLDDLRVSAITEGIALPGDDETFTRTAAERSLMERITDIAADGSYLTNEGNYIGLLHDADGNTSSYVPGTSRLGWNGVFSPDETSIAFMSKPKSGGYPDIYIVPIAGGEPVKVPTDGLLLAGQLECETGTVGGGVTTSMLIDWR